VRHLALGIHQKSREAHWQWSDWAWNRRLRGLDILDVRASRKLDLALNLRHYCLSFVARLGEVQVVTKKAAVPSAESFSSSFDGGQTVMAMERLSHSQRVNSRTNVHYVLPYST